MTEQNNLNLEEALQALADLKLTEDRMLLLKAELYLDVDESQSIEMLQEYCRLYPERVKLTQAELDEFMQTLRVNAADQRDQITSKFTVLGDTYCGECTALGQFRGRYAYDVVRNRWICRPC